MGIALAIPCVGLAQEPGSVPSPSPFNYTRTSQFGYDAGTGLLTNEAIEPTIVSVCASTSYTPDSYGNRATITTQNCAGASADALFASRTTKVSYSNSVGGAQAGIVNGQFAYTTTDALGHQVTRQFDSRFGSVTNETLVSSPANLTTTTAYDGFGRKTSEARADGTQTQWIYEYCAGFDPNVTGGGTVACPTVAAGTSNVHLVTRVTQKPLGPNGAQNGPQSRTYQDSLGRDVMTQTQSALDPTQWATSWVVIDAMGHTVQKSEPYFDSDPPALAFNSTSIVWTTTQYDLLGRPVQIQRPDATAMTAIGASTQVATTTITYTDLTVVTTSPPTLHDPNGQTSTQRRDSQGHVIEVVDAKGSVLVRQYDAFGNVVATFDQYGNTITALFDLRGRKYQSNDPDLGQWTYGYDALGEMVWQQSPNERAAGQKTSFTFDALGRMSTRTLPEYTTTWTYDTYASGAACAYGTLKLCEVAIANPTEGNLDRKYTYDSAGRPLSDTYVVTSGPTFVSSMAYDPGTALVASRTYPSGLQVSYGYSATGYLNLITNAGAMLWSLPSGGVNARGQIVQQNYGNGVQTKQTFDAQSGRLLTIQSQLSTQAAGALVNLGFNWDPLSNLMSRSDANGDGAGVAATDTYGYDSLNRLTTDQVTSAAIAGGSRTVSIAYNEIGNILSKSDVAGTYGYGASGAGGTLVHAVQQVGAITYQYDANGNVTSASGGLWRSVSYTSFNLPNDSATGGLTGPNGVRYKWRYGPNLERVREDRTSATGTRTTWFLHPDNAGGLSFEQETAENNSVTNRHYITAGGRVIVVLNTAPSAPTTVSQADYWHVDQVGSLVAVTGGAANLVERYAYDPFGKRRFADGNFDATNALFIDATHYVDQSATLALLTTTRGTARGFTTHEQLDDLGLIHMNGRLYDAVLGRFMQADPTIQYALLLQDYNRYSYLMNNPLAGFDPSGYTPFGFLGELVEGWVDALTGWMPGWLRQITAIAVAAVEMYYGMPPDPSFWEGLAVSAGSGFSAGLIATGRIDGGIQGAITASLFYGAGSLAGLQTFSGIEGDPFRVVFHAVAGCLSSAMQGGNCGKGALSAGVSEFLGSRIPNISGDAIANAAEHVVAYAVIGGTSSVLSGGKFGNGAMTGAFQYIFNHWAHLAELAAYGREAHQILQTYEEEHGYVVESKCATPANCVDGRFDIADPRTKEVWEIKRNSLFGLEMGDKALDAYTSSETGLHRGGDLYDLKVGGEIEFRTADTRYVFTNYGDGLIGYSAYDIPHGPQYEFRPIFGPFPGYHRDPRYEP